MSTASLLLLLRLMIHLGGDGHVGGYGGHKAQETSGVREEVGRGRGRRGGGQGRGALGEGRGEGGGVALGLRVREHSQPFAEAAVGQEAVIQASR